jgi:hypothetical protein
MKPYSEDLRMRIVKAVQEDMSKLAAAHLFDVSLSSVKRYARIASWGESLEPRKAGGRPTKDRPDDEDAARRGREGAPCGHCLTADFSVVDPQRMMCTYGPAEGSTQSFVHAWLVWVNINAIRCQIDASSWAHHG